MTKLLYITNGITGSGGLERVLAIKVSALVATYNYEVHILVLNESNPKPFYAFHPAITFHNVEAKGNPFHYFKAYHKGIKEVLKTVNPNLISVCDDGLKGLLFPLLFGKKTAVIYERHVSKQITLGTKNSLSRFFLNTIMNFAAKRFDKFIVLTQGNLQEWLGVDAVVIPNPLPFEPTEKASLENHKMIMVGKQSYQKGQDILLDIWKKWMPKNTDWQLNMYGNHTDFNTLVARAELADAIVFHSPEKNIVAKYQEASFYVLPSRFEGFGMVLIEAMACGLPCIAFDCPHGPAAIITDGVDGFLVPLGDDKAFADKMLLLMNDKNLRQRMGAQAQSNVQRYQQDVIVNKWHVLFQNSLKNVQNSYFS